ncbi:SRPBCC family protein [bacterium]|nr:SRPBCC family protein [bacterium]
MNITGPEVAVAKPADELLAYMGQFSNFESLMPEEVVQFEAYEDGFTFGLKGFPAVKLMRADDAAPGTIALKSRGGMIDFRLVCTVQPTDETHSTAQLVFDGDLNPMLRMMVEKPLTHLIQRLSEAMGQLR